ncbi:MAG: cell division protein FtsZ [Pseudomonadota bacterium]
MTINLSMPDITELKPKITVFGVGGAGGNAVNNMIKSGLEGVDFVVANTDAQALTSSQSERIIQMGLQVTEGLGAGSQPDIGRQAAEEVIDEINDYLTGSHMAFITAGMGGGTGTGAAPVVARAAREQGILTVGVVTKPFQFEGVRRMRIADLGIEELQANVDTLIVIPNQNLFRIANEKTTFADAFSMADQVLYSGVACITDLMVKEGLINLDFADVRSVMKEMGKAMMGTGEASGERRAIEAAEAAIANPLLDETSMQGAQGLLISITGGNDLTLFEVDEAADRIREEVDSDANIILGATFDESLEGVVRVSVVATGIESAAGSNAVPELKEASTFMRPVQTAQKVTDSAATQAAAALNAQAAIEAELAIAEPREVAPTPVPAPQEAIAEVAKTDPAVTIKPFTPSAEAYQIAKGTDIPAVEDFDAPKTQMPVEDAAAPSGPFIPPAAEKPFATTKMPSVDDFPMIVQQEIRAKSTSSLDMGEDEERGAMGLLKRIKTATLGGRKDETEAARVNSLSGAPTAAPAAVPAAPVAPQPQAPVQQAQAPSPAQAPAPAPAASAPVQATSASAFTKMAQPRQQVASSAAAPAGNLDAQGRAVPGDVKKSPEDQLEIPAFLRRQAN